MDNRMGGYSPFPELVNGKVFLVMMDSRKHPNDNCCVWKPRINVLPAFTDIFPG
jgi:hypothetical protein